MKAKAITAYVCGSCGVKSDTKTDAERCCICQKCGERPVRASDEGAWRNDKCDRCFLRECIRNTKENLRKTRSVCADYEKHLAELQAQYAALKYA